MSHELIPFHINSQNEGETVERNITHFSLGNIGIRFSIGRSAIYENCLLLKVTPMALIHDQFGEKVWIESQEKKQEYVLPVSPDEPLLLFTQTQYDHMQWSNKYIKLFWNREVLKINCVKSENGVMIYFKKLYWDGRSVTESNNARKTYALSEKDYDYSLSLANGLNEKEYGEFLQEEALRQIKFDEKDRRKEEVRESVNKVLKVVGLQLRES